MFFVVRSNDSFNFPLGLIKYIVIVIYLFNTYSNTVRTKAHTYLVNTLSVDVKQHRTKANTYLVNALSVDVKQHRMNGQHLLGQYTLCGRKATQNERPTPAWSIHSLWT